MAKKKTEDKVVPEVIAKCDNLRWGLSQIVITM